MEEEKETIFLSHSHMGSFGLWFEMYNLWKDKEAEDKEMSLQSPKQYLPVRVLYIWFLVAISIVVMAFMWYGFHTVMAQVATVSREAAIAMETNSSTYDAVDTFFTNIDTWFLVIFLFGIALFAYSYSQKRGYPV